MANMVISTSELGIFHTPEGVGYVAITNPENGQRCHPIQSDAMKAWVRLRYYQATGKTLSREALTEVLDLLEAKAIYTAPEEEVHVRVAGHGSDVYYDLGQPDGTMVKIAPATGNWTLVREVPVRFHRPNGFGMQAIPERGGNLDDLRDLLHLDDKAWVLILAFLLISMRPTHPYMVLLLSGGHGSGKSKISELIKRIIDPNALEKFPPAQGRAYLGDPGSNGLAAGLRQHLGRAVGSVGRPVRDVDGRRIQHPQILYR
jgi:hypothetical protein